MKSSFPSATWEGVQTGMFDLLEYNDLVEQTFLSV